MDANWKRLLTTLGIVVFAMAVLGTLTWSQMNKIIYSQNEAIFNLQNQANELSYQYTQKIQEKNAKEEAQKQTTNSNTTSKTTTTTTQEESAPQEEPTHQSQILYFYNPSCGTCIAQEPIVIELQNQGIPFVWENIIENPSLIGQYAITSTPTFILNGQRRGFSTKAQLENFWNTYK